VIVCFCWYWWNWTNNHLSPQQFHQYPQNKQSPFTSTIPPKSTKQTITSHLNSLNINMNCNIKNYSFIWKKKYIGGESLQVFYHLLISAFPLEKEVIGISLTNLTLPHCCACAKPGGYLY
jgi:hypothetical protein